jgi:hypothetical protein
VTKLTVHEAREDDVFDDIVRVNLKYRFDRRGEPIRAGTVCRVSIGDRSALAIARGLPPSEGAIIRLDESTRRTLGVKSGIEVDVTLQRVCFFGEWIWGWSASDPAYRIASRLAVLSVVLGGVGLVLGTVSLFR